MLACPQQFTIPHKRNYFRFFQPKANSPSRPAANNASVHGSGTTLMPSAVNRAVAWASRDDPLTTKSCSDWL